MTLTSQTVPTHHTSGSILSHDIVIADTHSVSSIQVSYVQPETIHDGARQASTLWIATISSFLALISGDHA